MPEDHRTGLKGSGFRTSQEMNMDSHRDTDHMRKARYRADETRKAMGRGMGRSVGKAASRAARLGYGSANKRGGGNAQQSNSWKN